VDFSSALSKAHNHHSSPLITTHHHSLIVMDRKAGVTGKTKSGRAAPPPKPLKDRIRAFWINEGPSLLVMALFFAAVGAVFVERFLCKDYTHFFSFSHLFPNPKRERGSNSLFLFFFLRDMLFVFRLYERTTRCLFNFGTWCHCCSIMWRCIEASR
jgi:hypothetical protein